MSLCDYELDGYRRRSGGDGSASSSGAATNGGGGTSGDDDLLFDHEEEEEEEEEDPMDDDGRSSSPPSQRNGDGGSRREGGGHPPGGPRRGQRRRPRQRNRSNEAGARRTSKNRWVLEQEVAYGREDILRLLAALNDEAASPKIRTVSISRSLQYALFFYSTAGAPPRPCRRRRHRRHDPGPAHVVVSPPRRGSSGPHHEEEEEAGEGRDEDEGLSDRSDRSGAGSESEGEGEGGGAVSSLSRLLEQVGELPNLRELLIEGEDRITQFVSTGTLPGVFACIQPSLPNLQRIHIDAMLALPTHSIPTLALCLSGAANLVDLTLSQLHFPNDNMSPSPDHVTSGGGHDHDLGSGGGATNHDFLLPLLRSVAALDRLRSLHLGCVVDHASESALTPDGLQALVRPPSSIQVLKLDSFRVTDAHLAVLRDMYARDGRNHHRSRGRVIAHAPPVALESLCLYRCENPQFTERGCQLILRALETHHECRIHYLFVSPRAVQSAWKSSHPSHFQRQVRLLCLLNQARRGHFDQVPTPTPTPTPTAPTPSEPEPAPPAGCGAAGNDRIRRHWIKFLATCSGDVNASYSILIKYPEIVRAPARAIAHADDGIEGGTNGETMAPSQDEPEQDVPQQEGSKRRRTGSVSSPTQEELSERVQL